MTLVTECSECGAEIVLDRATLYSGSPWGICHSCLPPIADPPPAEPGPDGTAVEISGCSDDAA